MQMNSSRQVQAVKISIVCVCVCARYELVSIMYVNSFDRWKQIHTNKLVEEHGLMDEVQLTERQTENHRN